jgi:hypothetical protein
MKKHYSVARSAKVQGKFKVIIAGSFWGDEDADLPLFDNIDEALDVAERLNGLLKKGIN